MQLTLTDRSVDLDTGRVTRAERVLGDLRAKELALLRYLARNPGRVVPRDEIVTEVWGRRTGAATGTVFTTIWRLRAAIEVDPSNPRHLLTTYGQGIRLVGARSLFRTNLVEDARPLVGRQAELARLADPAARWVGLVGPPGMGKTRLARAFAFAASHDLEGGAWFCDASHLRSTEEVADAVAALLGAVGPASITGELALRGPTLLVVDGPDTVAPVALGQTLRDWLVGAPSLRILTTTRHAFGEDLLLPIGPLELPSSPEGLDGAAAELLLREIRVNAPRFQPESGLRSVLEALGGVPLALEIAAPTVASVGVQGTLDLLRTEQTLRSGDRSLLDLVGAWFDQLPEPLRQVVVQLAAFRTFTVDAARQVVDDREVAASIWLPETCRRGMVAQSATWPGRFEVVGLVRTVVPPDPAAQRRHQAHYTRWAVARMEEGAGLVPPLRPADRPEVDEWIAAAELATPSDAEDGTAELLDLAIRFGLRAGRAPRVRALLDRALASDPAPRARVRLRAILAERWYAEGQHDAAHRAWAQLPAEAMRAGVAPIAVDIELLVASDLTNQSGSGAEAVRRAERWWREMSPRSARFDQLIEAELLQRRCDQTLLDSDAAASFAAVTLAADALDRVDLGVRAHHGYAQVLVRRWEVDEAQRLVERAIDSVGWYRWLEVGLRCVLCEAQIRAGRLDDAERSVDRAAELGSGAGVAATLPRTTLLRGVVDLARGSTERAYAAAERVISLGRSLGQPRFELLGRLLRLGVPDAIPDPALDREMDDLISRLSDRRMFAAAIQGVGRIADRWLEDSTRPDPVPRIHRLLDTEIGSHEVELLTVLAELPGRLPDVLRSRVERAVERHHRARTTWLVRWWASQEGERVIPTFVDTADPWVKVYQARIWRDLGRRERAAETLAEVRVLPEDPLLARAVAILTRL